MSLPHLTWLLRERRSLTVETPGGVELEAHLDALDPFRNRLSLRLEAASPPVDPGDLLRLSFGYAGQRWAARVPLHHYPNRSLFVVGLPKAFEAADRRAHPRWIPEAPFGEVRLRTALGEGWELQGSLVSLSEGGVAVGVRRGLGPQGEEDRAWDRQVVKGQTLPVVALHLDGETPLDLEGLVAWVHDGVVGLRLRGLTASGRERLRAFLGPRLIPLPEALPGVPAQEAAPDPDLALLPEAAPPPRERNAALRRLKRRGRTLALAMRAGRARDALQDFLEAEGFGAVFPVETLAQWLELVAHRALDLVFIDGGFRELQGLELASFLQQSRGGQTFSLVLAQGPPFLPPDLAREAGVDRLLEKPYGLEADLLACLDQALEAGRGEAPATEGPLLALVMPAGPEREALEAYLLTSGRFRVRPVDSLAGLVRLAREPLASVVLVDWEEGGLSSVEVLAFLVKAAPDFAGRLVAACHRGRPQVMREAREQGAAQVLMRPYALEAPLLALLRRVAEGGPA